LAGKQVASCVCCSGALALVFFVIGFAGSLFVRDGSWSERLLVAGITAGMAFAAAVLLSSRDLVQHAATRGSVRKDLLARGDTTDDDFVSSRPTDQIGLLLETRKAIARFFDVPAEKVDRDIHLIRDLHVDKLEPAFQFFVVQAIIASQQVRPQPFGFSMADLVTLDDFTTAIRKVLDGFAQSGEHEVEREV
jgi:hypothetical protein